METASQLAQVICHGIPDCRPLEDGDLVNVDVTLYRHGFHADTARTWMCGEADPAGSRLHLSNVQLLCCASALSRDRRASCGVNARGLGLGSAFRLAAPRDCLVRSQSSFAAGAGCRCGRLWSWSPFESHRRCSQPCSVLSLVSAAHDSGPTAVPAR